ncbi:unnamed protein product [Schistosoma curassoni]|uniref:Reverse transcriptase domain-containing protein n=1 Tax=Schistosoma curassoni TaxID=6186 RepID=A0A183KSU4_9TREM|nr:unnamed protein product [Schistosoma curassoni]
MDDIMVVGSSAQELICRLEVLLTKISQAGSWLRKEKLEVPLGSVNYLGHAIDKNRRRPDADNINDIKNMLKPTDFTIVRLFLGLIGYYGTFVP